MTTVPMFACLQMMPVCTSVTDPVTSAEMFTLDPSEIEDWAEKWLPFNLLKQTLLS